MVRAQNRAQLGSSFNGPYATRLVCVVLYPLEVDTIVAWTESLAVTPYQRVLCNGLVVSLLVISPKEV